MLGWSRCLDMCKNNLDAEGWLLQVREDSKRANRRKTAPYWLPCTGRRTSVSLIGPHTLLERSSVCSHVRPELQKKQSDFNFLKCPKMDVVLIVMQLAGAFPSEMQCQLWFHFGFLRCPLGDSFHWIISCFM